MKRVFILHCFGGNSRGSWYQSAGEALESKYAVTIPDLPEPEIAPYETWQAALTELNPDVDTLLIGHSLGGTLILRYLEQSNRPVVGFILVGAPMNDLARNDLHQTGFFERDFNWAEIQKNAPTRLVVASTDDPVVPFWQAEYINQNVAGELVRFEDKAHFNQKEFPELIEQIHHYFEKENNG